MSASIIHPAPGSDLININMRSFTMINKRTTEFTWLERRRLDIARLLLNLVTAIDPTTKAGV